MIRLYDADGAAAQLALPTVFDAWGRPIRYVHPAFSGTVTDDVSSTTPAPTASRTLQQHIGSPGTATYQVQRIRRNDRVDLAAGDAYPPLTTAQADLWVDSDGGICQNGRPYFYSAGEDGLVGLRKAAGTGETVADFNKDNVYTTVPVLPK